MPSSYEGDDARRTNEVVERGAQDERRSRSGARQEHSGGTDLFMDHSDMQPNQPINDDESVATYGLPFSLDLVTGAGISDVSDSQSNHHPEAGDDPTGTHV